MDKGGPVKLLLKLVSFVIVFSVVFYLIRTRPDYHQVVALGLKDLGGVPWLYSIIGMIFSMLAAFTIQSEWEHGSQLLGAIKEEVSALDQFWHWSHHFPEKLRPRIHQGLRQYLALTIEEGWGRGGPGAAHEAVEDVLASFRDVLLELAQKPELMITASSILAEIVKHRWSRLNASARRMPRLLRYTLVFADGLVITLSLFVGVRDIRLDYLFTMSIALLAYLVYLVVEDLDDPMRPGIWHVTPADYQQLLGKVQAREAGRLAPFANEPGAGS